MGRAYLPTGDGNREDSKAFTDEQRQRGQSLRQRERREEEARLQASGGRETPGEIQREADRETEREKEADTWGEDLGETDKTRTDCLCSFWRSQTRKIFDLRKKHA